MTDKPTFVYVTYIESTPENVWHALTDADLTGDYWGHLAGDRPRAAASALGNAHGAPGRQHGPERRVLSYLLDLAVPDRR